LRWGVLGKGTWQVGRQRSGSKEEDREGCRLIEGGLQYGQAQDLDHQRMVPFLKKKKIGFLVP
jgi:hypothetical protein